MDNDQTQPQKYNEDTPGLPPQSQTTYTPSFLLPRSVRTQSAQLPVARQLVVAITLLLVVFGATYMGTVATFFDTEKKVQPDVTVSTLIESTVSDASTNPFDNVKIEGKAAFVWDVRDQRILFNKNADEILPLASITKLMTSLVAYELLGSDAAVDISIDAIRTDGDSGFISGEEFSFHDLADITLIASSNDGATALGAAAGSAVGMDIDPQYTFVTAMNIRAEELGLAATHFKNVTGLDISPSEAGAYSSARDVALLMEYLITTYPHIVAQTTTDTTLIKNTDGAYHTVKNTNDIVTSIDGIIASKTGYTELAGGNLVIAFDAGLNHPVIVVVLGSSTQGRFTDVSTLVDRTRIFVSQKEVI